MQLAPLLRDLASDVPDVEVTGISEDSRRIIPGMVFVAVPGSSLDGHAFVSDAVRRGAAAVIAERPVPAGIPVIRVPSARTALATIAARFFGNPAAALHLVGFTGTFGKTSTSDILRQLLDAGGHRTGVLGSLGARYGSLREASGGLTTPAPVELHAALRDLKDAGADTVVMEVTSHALRMQRAAGLSFSGGLLAAIMPGEHTDFHRTYEDYVDAKRLFLEYLRPDAILAYDADNRAARTLAAEARVRRAIGFSIDGAPADMRIEHVHLGPDGASFLVNGTAMHSALLGRGHLRNAALALAYALHTGIDADSARDVLARLTPLRRRMERFEVAGRFVLDDTAAHPESVRATFETAATLPHGALVAVYALRGSRGTDINRGNALALADLASLHQATLIVTDARDVTGPNDGVTDAEHGATESALASRGQRFMFEARLDDATRVALERTEPGDLILLIGAQGMDRGRELLELAESSEG